MIHALLLLTAFQTTTPQQPHLPPPPAEHRKDAPAKAAPTQPAPQTQPAKADKPDKATELTELEKLRVDNATLRAVVFQYQAKEQQNALLEQRAAIVKAVEAAHPGSHVTQDPRTGETRLEADKPAQTDKPPLPDKPK